MKKIAAAIITAFMILALCLSFAGCKEEEIKDAYEYTAEKPIISFADYEGMEEIASFDNFKDFKDYYLNNLRGSELFLFRYYDYCDDLNLSDRNYSILLDFYPSVMFAGIQKLKFTFYRNTKTGEVWLRQLLLCDDEYVYYKDECNVYHDMPNKVDNESEDLKYYHNDYIVIDIMPSTDYIGRDFLGEFLHFEFGSDSGNGLYVNVTPGNVNHCFATCYLSYGQYVTSTPLLEIANMLSQYLKWGDLYDY